MSLSKEHRLIHRLGPPPGPRMDPGADGPKESLSLDEVIDGGLDHHITKLGEKIKGVEDRIKGLGDLSFSIENKAPNHVVLHVTLRNPKGMAAALAGNPEMINAMMASHAEEMSRLSGKKVEIAFQVAEGADKLAASGDGFGFSKKTLDAIKEAKEIPSDGKNDLKKIGACIKAIMLAIKDMMSTISEALDDGEDDKDDAPDKPALSPDQIARRTRLTDELKHKSYEDLLKEKQEKADKPDPDLADKLRDLDKDIAEREEDILDTKKKISAIETELVGKDGDTSDAVEKKREQLSELEIDLEALQKKLAAKKKSKTNLMKHNGDLEAKKDVKELQAMKKDVDTQKSTLDDFVKRAREIVKDMDPKYLALLDGINVKINVERLVFEVTIPDGLHQTLLNDVMKAIGLGVTVVYEAGGRIKNLDEVLAAAPSILGGLGEVA